MWFSRPIKVNVETRHGVAVATLDGVLGFDERDFAAVKNLMQRLEESRCTQVVLDLTRAQCAWPSSLGLLFKPFLDLQRNKVARVVVACRENTSSHSVDKFSREGFALTKLDTVFPTFASVADAIKSFQA